MNIENTWNYGKCQCKRTSLPQVSHFNASSWITYSDILYDKQPKSPHTETFFLNKRLYFLLTCWTAHCTKTL